MPEMTFTVRWPDGREQDCYSPSLVVHEHLQAQQYTVADFTGRALTALALASDRVQAAYGFPCSRAAATAEQIRRAAAAHPAGATVEVLRLWPPMPA